MCDENTIVRPAAAIERQQRHHAQSLARVHAVERLVEKQDRRLVDEAPASLARWRIPFEYVPIAPVPRRPRGRPSRCARAAAASGSATSLQACVESRRIRVRSGSSRTASRSGTRPTSLYIEGGAMPVSPWTETRTGPTGEQPGHQVRSVDFPAPFGPRRPVTPGPSPNEMSLTATTLPYQRATCSTSRAGIGGRRRGGR